MCRFPRRANQCGRLLWVGSAADFDSLCFLSVATAVSGRRASPVANAGMYNYALPLVGPNGLSIGSMHMPKFLRVGVHQSNVSGYTSKAWWVRRGGSTIFLKWGAVEVDGVGDGRKVYW